MKHRKIKKNIKCYYIISLSKTERHAHGGEQTGAEVVQSGEQWHGKRGKEKESKEKNRQRKKKGEIGEKSSKQEIFENKGQTKRGKPMLILPEALSPGGIWFPTANNGVLWAREEELSI